MKYKDIAAKYGVTLNTVKSWKQRNGWTRDGTGKVASSKKRGCTQNQKGCTQKYRGCSR
nr:phage terminase small subunit-related protein [Secundilactobacillus oryzae]